MPAPTITPTAIARFWARVNKEGPVHPVLGTRCWEWTGCRVRGYGQLFRAPGTPDRTHRISWELAHGAIPPGMYVCHKCDNPPCVNPEHLFVGTSSDNHRDCVAKGRTRHPTGDAHWTRRMPERLPTADEHWTRRHPELLPRGDRSGPRKHPETRPRGDRHGSRTHPESTAKGERNGHARLTAAQVVDMRRRFTEGERVVDLAREHSVHAATVWDAVHCKTWRHISSVLKPEKHEL